MVSTKRVRRLLETGRAVWVEEGKALQLTYEPRGPGRPDHPFYLQERVNRCVVCGSLDHLSRHHVVPRCLVTNMPHCYAEWSGSHDQVLLCVDCHTQYEDGAMRLKMEMYRKAFPADIVRDRKRFLHAYGIARTLADGRNPIPEQRRQVLMSKMQECCPHLTLEELLAHQHPGGSIRNEDWKYVVDYLGGPEPTIEYWRKHFLETMRPKYMPELWSIELDKTVPIRNSARIEVDDARV